MEKLDLHDPVGRIPLIGKAQTKKLKKLGIETVEDLLNHYPFRYEDFSQVKKISALVVDEPATIGGQILKIKNIYTRYGKRLTKGVVADETGELLLVWFNQPYIVKNLKEGDRVSLSGRLSRFNGKPAFVSPEYEVVTQMSADSKTDGRRLTVHTGRLVPIYPETAGITSKWLRSRVNATIQQFNNLTIDEIEFLPKSMRFHHRLLNLKDAINLIHFPQNQKEIKEAKKRLAFDELFLLQLKSLKRRQSWKKKKAVAKLDIGRHTKAIRKFADSLPFKLTRAQERCVRQLFFDLSRNTPMNRLLEGDVGSGKTVVAALGLLATHLCGYRSLYMAPTEILAEQVFATLKKYFEPFNITVGLLTGSKKPPDTRYQTLDVLVGTHALLYRKDSFPKVAFTVIDEQHRFGVEQRAQLLKKVTSNQSTSQPVNQIPHLLTMTATPIPRSLALTIYGDLDLSLLDEMPKGRQKVKTWVVPPEKRKAAYRWIRKQIANAENQETIQDRKMLPILDRRTQRSQAFIICPLIEESEAETLKSVRAVTEEFKRLKKAVFPDLALGLLHGKLKSKEKEAVVKEFRQGGLDILVSTPVVEVGVDIPNATIMMVEGAERFGLASLHQLRGRVGRGKKQSYCLLFTDTPGRKIIGRLKSLEKHHSGTTLAEIDLKFRGPGDFYGTQQHGFLDLKIARLSDLKLVKTAKGVAKEIIKVSPQLDKYLKLRDKLERVMAAEVEPN